MLEPEGVREAGLSEVVAKRPVLLGLRWREPIACAYRKLDGEAGGPPPLVVASAVHADDDGDRLRVAVRDGYDVLSGSALRATDVEEVLSGLRGTALGDLPAAAWEVVRSQIADLLGGRAAH
ncbi:hypothetical protein [Streptomyces sp. NPDC001292]|uniref:hypothetical protein n=1 Tax=Streptomyces sp. NPDC001292 TaxID=3364558 RepID=UPI0036B5E922